VEEEKERIFKAIEEIELESILDALEKISDAYEEEDRKELLSGLLELAASIRNIAPAVSPVIGVIIREYGESIRPFVDELVNIGVEGLNYTLEKSAQMIEGSLQGRILFEKARAKEYMAKIEALQEAGFSREEAMSILLSEMIRSFVFWQKINEEVKSAVETLKKEKKPIEG